MACRFEVAGMLLFDMETACQNGDTEHIDETDGEREKTDRAHETQNKARTEMFRGPGQNCREAPPRDWTRTGGGARKKWGVKSSRRAGPGSRRGSGGGLWRQDGEGRSMSSLEEPVCFVLLSRRNERAGYWGT